MRTRKILLFLLLTQLVYTASFAQLFDNIVYNRKAVYAEVLGSSIGASLNFEYLYNDNMLKQGFRFGPGYFVNIFEKNQPTVFSFTGEYVAFAGARNHHLEYGLGATFHHKYYKQNYQTTNYYINGSDTLRTYTDHTYKYQKTGPAIVPRLGYRYESPDGGLVIRLGYTPLLYLFNTEKEFIDGTQTSKSTTVFKPKFSWGGVCIGFSFY
ncbi:MAG TPA: hypothetical protein VGF30_08895 [Bacteroidia bacterium]